MVLRGRSGAAVDDNESNLHKPLAAETAQQAATVVRLVERTCVSHGRSVREKTIKYKLEDSFAKDYNGTA